MTGRIITARHGRPDLSRDLRVTTQGYGAWWARYDETGLAPEERAPERLIEIVRSAKTILSSSLPRAVETAAKATRGARAAPADPLFVEAPLPPPPIPFLKLRPGTWGVISRAMWILGYAPEGVESSRATWRRVGKIAARLTDHAGEGDVVLFAHGFLNWMLDKRLRKDGWVRAERDGGNYYWSWRIYEPPGLKREVEATAAAE